MAHVLIVEDQPLIARLLHGWVEAHGDHPLTAASAEQALLLAAQHAPAVALCDIHLPGGRDGFWLLEQLHLFHPATVAVMTTGDEGVEMALAGLRAGVSDYVLKPYTQERVTGALSRAMAEHAARQAALAARLGAYAGASRSSDAPASTTAALLAVLYADDDVMARRAQRVSRLAASLADALEMSAAAVSDVEHAALLRGVRRLDIQAMARRVPALAPASAIVTSLEERFDGTGPLGLRGEMIPRGARVIAVAAAYDELTAAGDAGPPSGDRAIEVLCGARASEFDPAVLKALGAVHAELSTTTG